MAVEIRIGDAIDQLRQIPDESVHCCVTSPPYWGLRDYGVDGQIGLEETPDEWCARLVEVFREVKRVLRNDGTCWVNLGDSYATGGHSHANDKKASHLTGGLRSWGEHRQITKATSGRGGLKTKDLIGQPWLLAFALRADGWYLRDAIVWAKPNPMPESVKDRCTNAYEHVFLLAKSKRYFFDAEAIKEPDLGTDHRRNVLTPPDTSGGFLSPHNGIRSANGRNGQGRNCRNVWTIATEPFARGAFRDISDRACAAVHPGWLPGRRHGSRSLRRRRYHRPRRRPPPAQRRPGRAECRVRRHGTEPHRQRAWRSTRHHAATQPRAGLAMPNPLTPPPNCAICCGVGLAIRRLATAAGTRRRAGLLTPSCPRWDPDERCEI